YFQEEPGRYEALVRMGAYGQITTGSVVGTFGSETAELSAWMVRRRLVHVLASDAHNVRGRPPVLSEAHAAVAALIGEEEADRMVVDNPRALLRGEEPDVPSPEEASEPRPSFFSRLFGRGSR